MREIRRIALHEIRLPLREPFVISSGRVEDRRILLFLAQDDVANRAVLADDSSGLVLVLAVVATEAPIV